jgi:hypothetical protein
VVETEKEVRAWANEWGEITSDIATKTMRAGELKKKIFGWLEENDRSVTITAAAAIAKRVENSNSLELRPQA